MLAERLLEEVTVIQSGNNMLTHLALAGAETAQIQTRKLMHQTQGCLLGTPRLQKQLAAWQSPPLHQCRHQQPLCGQAPAYPLQPSQA